MSDCDDFLAWVNTSLYEAELALHNGDAAPRRALWCRDETVSVLGAWRNAHGQEELDELFTSLERSFSDCASFEFELLAYDVVGDMAYTAGFEHTSASVDGQPRSYTLRTTRCTAAKTANGESLIAMATPGPRDERQARLHAPPPQPARGRADR
jgi:ketosteroid isomerase-like protein